MNEHTQALLDRALVLSERVPCPHGASAWWADREHGTIHMRGSHVCRVCQGIGTIPNELPAVVLLAVSWRCQCPVRNSPEWPEHHETGTCTCCRDRCGGTGRVLRTIKTVQCPDCKDRPIEHGPIEETASGAYCGTCGGYRTILDETEAAAYCGRFSPVYRLLAHHTDNATLDLATKLRWSILNGDVDGTLAVCIEAVQELGVVSA